MTENEDELAQAFVLGVTAGQMLDDAAAAPCANCTCGLADPDVEHEERAVPNPLDFGEEVRELLEQYDAIEGDEIVSRVRVCPDEVVAYVRDEP